MTLDTLTVPKDVAKRKLDAVRKELRRRRKPIDDEISRLERAYEAAAEGTPVIQLRQVILAGGFFEGGMPKIAVARSDAERVRCEVWNSSNGVGHRRTAHFESRSKSGNGLGDTTLVDIGPPIWNGGLPSGTTIVPLVPPDALDAAKVSRSQLRRYLTLFEVERWEPVPPVDPALLQHIAGDLYAVLAVWDLTELERAVIAGR